MRCGIYVPYATRMDYTFIRPDTHLSPCEMYHEENPTWIPFLRSFGEIEIVESPSKLQAKLQNRGTPGI
jgi:hypothetical protein